MAMGRHENNGKGWHENNGKGWHENNVKSRHENIVKGRHEDIAKGRHENNVKGRPRVGTRIVSRVGTRTMSRVGTRTMSRAGTRIMPNVRFSSGCGTPSGRSPRWSSARVLVLAALLAAAWLQLGMPVDGSSNFGCRIPPTSLHVPKHEIHITC